MARAHLMSFDFVEQMAGVVRISFHICTEYTLHDM